MLPGRNHPKTFDKKLFNKLIKVKERALEIEERRKEVREDIKYVPFLYIRSFSGSKYDSHWLIGEHVSLHKFK